MALTDAAGGAVAVAASMIAVPPPARHGVMSKPLKPLGTAELAAAARFRQDQLA